MAHKLPPTALKKVGKVTAKRARKQQKAIKKQLSPKLRKRFKVKNTKLGKNTLLIKSPVGKKVRKVSILSSAKILVVNADELKKSVVLQGGNAARPIMIISRGKTLFIKHHPDGRTIVVLIRKGVRITVSGKSGMPAFVVDMHKRAQNVVVIRKKPKGRKQKILRKVRMMEKRIVGLKPKKAKKKSCNKWKKYCLQKVKQCAKSPKSKGCKTAKRVCKKKARKCKFSARPSAILKAIKQVLKAQPPAERKKIQKMLKKARGTKRPKKIIKMLRKKLGKVAAAKIIKAAKKRQSGPVVKIRNFLKRHVNARVTAKSTLTKHTLTISRPGNKNPLVVELPAKIKPRLVRVNHKTPLAIPHGTRHHPVFIAKSFMHSLVIITGHPQGRSIVIRVSAKKSLLVSGKSKQPPILVRLAKSKRIVFFKKVKAKKAKISKKLVVKMFCKKEKKLCKRSPKKCKKGETKKACAHRKKLCGRYRKMCVFKKLTKGARVMLKNVTKGLNKKEKKRVRRIVLQSKKPLTKKAMIKLIRKKVPKKIIRHIKRNNK